MKTFNKKAIILLLIDSKEEILTPKLDELSNFKKILHQGISTFLIKSSNSNINVLISILGFSKTFEKDPFFQKSSFKTNELVHFYDKKKNEKIQIIEEDTMTEIRYIEKPISFDQVSNRMKTLVFTNNENNAKFCQFINLDYCYAQEMANFKGNLEKSLKDNYEMIIFDVNEQNLASGEKLFDLLQKFNEEILETIIEDISYYILFKPFAFQLEKLEKIINCHKDSIDLNNPLKDKIKRLIPKQTYEYLNGNINEEFSNLNNVEIVFSLFYEIGGCRMDKLTSFKEVGLIENANLVGNKIINSHLFMREITFRLGKLPKFGA